MRIRHWGFDVFGKYTSIILLSLAIIYCSMFFKNLFTHLYETLSLHTSDNKELCQHMYTFLRSIVEKVHVFQHYCSRFRQYGIVHEYLETVHVIRMSVTIFEWSAFNFGGSTHVIRPMKGLFRHNTAFRQVIRYSTECKRFRQYSCVFDI